MNDTPTVMADTISGVNTEIEQKIRDVIAVMTDREGNIDMFMDVAGETLGKFEESVHMAAFALLVEERCPAGNTATIMQLKSALITSYERYRTALEVYEEFYSELHPEEAE